MLDEILNMGGYGSYVWPCYILWLFSLVGYLIYSIRASKATLQKLKSVK